MNIFDVERLESATLRLAYQAEDFVCFPDHVLNVWRGQLGRFLHHVSPPGAPADAGSLYHLFFETPQAIAALPEGLPARLMGRLGLSADHVPHPFVLRGLPLPPAGEALMLSPGDAYTLELVLVGRALDYLPLLCPAFGVLGSWGLGRAVPQRQGGVRRGRLSLSRALLIAGNFRLELYDGRRWYLPEAPSAELYSVAKRHAPSSCPEPGNARALELRAQTPIRITRAGRPVDPDSFSLSLLGVTLFRRAISLSTCYCGYVPTEEELRIGQEEIEALAASTTVAARLRWTDRSRYSARQRAAVPDSGLLGRIRLEADAATCSAWRSFARLASTIHIGKSTSAGSGWLVEAEALREGLHDTAGRPRRPRKQKGDQGSVQNSNTAKRSAPDGALHRHDSVRP